jgi:hypothetical protein
MPNDNTVSLVCVSGSQNLDEIVRGILRGASVGRGRTMA